MNNNKLQIAFSPTTEMWSFQVFRDLIKEIVLDVEGSDIYIITGGNTDSELINDIVIETGLNTDNIFIVNDSSDIFTKLETINISIFLTDNIELQREVNSQNPISLLQNNVSGTQAILINNIIDVNKLQFKYFTYLKFWTDQIKKYK